MAQEWHSKKEIRDRLLALHQLKVAYPNAFLARTKAQHEANMVQLRAKFQEQGVALRFEYTGSSYEALKVRSTDMEYDVMVVLSGGNNLKEVVIKQGWAKLLPQTQTDHFKKIVGVGQYLEPLKTTSYFCGILEKAKNNMPGLGNLIKLRMHGPAVQMDVYRDVSKTQLQYSVDMVPSYQLKDGSYYVAKPYKGDTGMADPLSWRQAFSLEEKRVLSTIDNGNKCSKQCIRLFTIMRDSEATLKPIVSFWLKAIVFNLKREEPHLDWSQAKLPERLFGMMGVLAGSLERGQLKHPFLHRVNLLENVSSQQKQNIASRLRELIRSETEFQKVLNRAEKDSC